MATASTRNLTARELQQEFARLYGTRDSIIWDLYTADEKEEVLNKLKFLIPDYEIDENVIKTMFDDPTITWTEKNKKINEYLSKPEKKNLKLAHHRTTLLNAIWAQRKYCNKDLLMSIIFVLVSPDRDFGAASTTYSVHPVFRIRKCKDRDNSENCCMIIIDENARVYQNWSDYVKNNKLPAGIMIAPRRGIYTFDVCDNVHLEICKTPESSPAQTALKAVDLSATLLGIGTAAIPIAAMFVPVAAPFVIFSAVSGISTGLWSFGRSTAQLVDRGKYQQSINITDRQARYSWLGIAGGILGMGATGVTQGVIGYAAKGGQVSNVAKAAINGVNVASLTVNGIGIGNGIVELILKANDDEDISTIDILQLSASVVLFTHSVYNFHYVSNIIKANNVSTMQQFRNMLGESQRKVFDNFVTQANRLTNKVQSKIDIIRGIGSIPDYGVHVGMGSNLPLEISRAVSTAQRIIKTVNGVVNPDDLKNCIFHMIEKITYTAIDVLIEITEQFFDIWGNYIQAKLKRVLPFEVVLWKAFNILMGLVAVNHVKEELIKSMADVIIKKLKDMYEANVQSISTTNIKCDQCHGYYSITPC